MKKANTLFYLGPEGCFSESAALSFRRSYNKKIDLFPVPSLDKVVQHLKRGSKNNIGIMAYYNILEGLVQETLDLIYEYNLKIIDVVKVPIVFHAAKVKNSRDTQYVYAHPKGLAQTSDWISKYYPKSIAVPMSSNSEAVAKVLSEKRGIAIAGPKALDNTNLKIIARNIGNKKRHTDNYTNFYVVSRHFQDRTSKRKRCLTMVAVTPHVDRPGLLAEILLQISYYGLNNYKLHSRPAIDDVKLKDYEPIMFYIEIMCHQEDDNFKRCIEAIRYKLTFKNKEIVRILGSYNID